MCKHELFDIEPRVKKRRLNHLPENLEKASSSRAVRLGRFPSWLHRKLPKGNELKKTGNILLENRLHTVCEEAKCPNLMECWSKRTATFLLMGKECSRSCGFCDIGFNPKPAALDPNEPENVADSVEKLGLAHVVITMVSRDDLPDGGAQHLANTIAQLRLRCPKTTVEVLTSDFEGNTNSCDLILAERPEIFSYNIETVRDLTPRIRHKASYERSLSLLHYVKTKVLFEKTKMHVKSGIMVGLGESDEQVRQTIDDLHRVGCDIITIGQYLQPNHQKLRVKAFITPEQFKSYEEYGHSLGLKHMYCGPFVRSSYNAHEVKKLVDRLD